MIRIGGLVLRSYAHGWEWGRPDAQIVKGKRTFCLRDARYSGTIGGALVSIFRRLLKGEIKGATDEDLEDVTQLLARLRKAEATILALPALQDLETARLDELREAWGAQEKGAT